MNFVHCVPASLYLPHFLTTYSNFLSSPAKAFPLLMCICLLLALARLPWYSIPHLPLSVEDCQDVLGRVNRQPSQVPFPIIHHAPAELHTSLSLGCTEIDVAIFPRIYVSRSFHRSLDSYRVLVFYFEKLPNTFTSPDSRASPAAQIAPSKKILSSGLHPYQGHSPSWIRGIDWVEKVVMIPIRFPGLARTGKCLDWKLAGRA